MFTKNETGDAQVFFFSPSKKKNATLFLTRLVEVDDQQTTEAEKAPARSDTLQRSSDLAGSKVYMR